jgi:hypothetical protein
MIAATRYEALYPALLQKLPAGVEPQFLLAALRDSARRFCDETKVWREDIGPFNVVADQAAYTLTTQWNASIDRVLEVLLNTAEGVTDGERGALQNLHGVSFDPLSNILTFDSAPTAAVTNGLLVRAVLVPNMLSDEIAELLINRYADGILAGAALYLAGSKAFAAYDEATAARSRQEWMRCKTKAVRDVACAYRDTSPRITAGWGFTES